MWSFETEGKKIQAQLRPQGDTVVEIDILAAETRRWEWPRLTIVGGCGLRVLVNVGGAPQKKPVKSDFAGVSQAHGGVGVPTEKQKEELRRRGTDNANERIV